MTSIRQHYIPRFLLKGFNSKLSQDKAFVWYYLNGNIPIEVSIRDIALEKSFYGEPGDESLDSLITEKEKAFADVLDQVRNNKVIQNNQLNTLSEFVGNMVIRTRHVRKGITEGMGKLINMTSSNLSNPTKVIPFLKSNIKNDINFRKQLNTSVRRNLGPLTSKVNDRFIIKVFEENIDKIGTKGGTLFSMFLDIYSNHLSTEMKKAHNNALRRLYEDGERSARLEQTIWDQVLKYKVFFNGRLDDKPGMHD